MKSNTTNKLQRLELACSNFQQENANLRNTIFSLNQEILLRKAEKDIAELGFKANKLEEVFEGSSYLLVKTIDLGEFVTIFKADNKNKTINFWYRTEPKCAREFRTFRYGEGIAGLVAKTKTGLCISNFQSDPRIRKRQITNVAIKSMIAVPILHNKKLLGIICVHTEEKPKSYVERIHQSFLEEMADILGMSINRFEIEESLTKQANIDHLTNVGNYASFNNTLPKEIKYSKKHNQPLSFLMFDIDDFKRLNTELGHFGADKILENIGGLLGSFFQKVSSKVKIFRIGGDEFAVLLPNIPTTEAKRSAEVFSTLLRKESDNKVTISGGLVTYPDDEIVLSEIKVKMDKELRKAKKGGKNQIISLSSKK